jgi:putative ABC transport system ATP-binding protein
MLKARNLVKGFHKNNERVEVLKGVSIDLSRGETAAVVGPSGSGKTTLLTLLAGLDRPDSGQVLFNDLEISSLGEKELSRFRAQNVGIVFQQFHLLQHLTALENVTLPIEIQGGLDAKARAEAALIEVGLLHRMNHQPSQLSGGECQRVAIARALVHRPALLLADEPSGNLDSATGAKVMDLLFELVGKSRSSLVLITHDSKLAERCQRQYEISDGKFL